MNEENKESGKQYIYSGGGGSCSSEAGESGAPAPTKGMERQARDIVNQYEDEMKHVRGYYSRIDLLAVAKQALRVGAPAPVQDSPTKREG